MWPMLCRRACVRYACRFSPLVLSSTVCIFVRAMHISDSWCLIVDHLSLPPSYSIVRVLGRRSLAFARCSLLTMLPSLLPSVPASLPPCLTRSPPPSPSLVRSKTRKQTNSLCKSKKLTCVFDMKPPRRGNKSANGAGKNGQSLGSHTGSSTSAGKTSKVLTLKRCGSTLGTIFTLDLYDKCS